MNYSKEDTQDIAEAAAEFVAVGWVANTAGINLRGRASKHDARGYVRVDDRVRRREDDDRSTLSSYPPLPHPRNRKRQLPLQEQLGESRQTRKGEAGKLDEPLIPKPSSSEITGQISAEIDTRRCISALASQSARH